MEARELRARMVARAPRWLRKAGRQVLVFEDRQNALHELRRSYAGPPRLRTPVERAVVVCYGNICRSPFAAELLARRLPDLQVRSRGLEARDGKAAEPGARRMALRHGIDLDDHTAGKMREDDVSWADLIVAMEGYQCARIRQRWPAAGSKAVLLGDFFERGPYTILDPYGHDDDVFSDIFHQIARAVELMARHIERAQGGG